MTNRYSPPHQFTRIPWNYDRFDLSETSVECDKLSAFCLTTDSEISLSGCIWVVTSAGAAESFSKSGARNNRCHVHRESGSLWKNSDQPSSSSVR